VLTLEIGGLTFREVPAGIHRKSIFAGETGLLGADLLSRFEAVTFDTPRDTCCWGVRVSRDGRSLPASRGSGYTSNPVISNFARDSSRNGVCDREAPGGQAGGMRANAVGSCSLLPRCGCV